MGPGPPRTMPRAHIFADDFGGTLCSNRKRNEPLVWAGERGRLADSVVPDLCAQPVSRMP